MNPTDDTRTDEVPYVVKLRRQLYEARKLLMEAREELDTLGRTGRRITAFLDGVDDE